MLAPAASPSPPQAARADRLGTAYATLLRGSDFLAASLQARAPGGQQALAGAGGAKVVGNGLRELDRFLSLLLDEGAEAIAAPGFDRPAYVRQSNVANKLETFYVLAGGGVPDGARLRAIGRVRACLHHCRGIVHDPALWTDLRIAAGSDSGAAPPALGRRHRLTVSFADLERICLFYAHAAGGLMAACRADRPVP